MAVSAVRWQLINASLWFMWHAVVVFVCRMSVYMNLFGGFMKLYSNVLIFYFEVIGVCGTFV